MLLAFVSILPGEDGRGAFRAINVVMSLVIALLSWLLAARLGAGPWGRAFTVAAVCLGVSLGPFGTFATADSTLTACVLGAALVGVVWWQNPERSTAIWFGLAITLACSMKFQGAYLLVFAAGIVLLRPHLAWRRRAEMGLAVLAPIAVFGGAWTVLGPSAPRRFAWHPPTHFGLSSIVAEPLRVFSPDLRFGWLGVVVLAASGACMWRARGSWRGRGIGAVLLIALVLAPFLYLSAMIVDDDTGPMDGRLLQPTRVLLSIAIAGAISATLSTAWRTLRSDEGRKLPALAFGVVAVLAVLSFSPFQRPWTYTLGQSSSAVQLAQAFVSHPHPQLRGSFTNITPDLGILVPGLEPGVLIFSNMPERLWFETGRVAIALPEKVGRTDNLPTPGYAEQVQLLGETLRTRPSVIVWCGGPDPVIESPQDLGLVSVAKSARCEVWSADPSA